MAPEHAGTKKQQRAGGMGVICIAHMEVELYGLAQILSLRKLVSLEGEVGKIRAQRMLQ